jgi:hypothetical protein
MKIQTLIAAALLCTAGATWAQAPGATPGAQRAEQRQAAQPQRQDLGAMPAPAVPRDAATTPRAGKHQTGHAAHGKSKGVVKKHKARGAHKAGKARKVNKKAGGQGKHKKHRKNVRPHRAPV